MIRRILAAALLLACGALRGATDLRSCAARLVLEADGSAQGRLVVQVSDAVPGAFDVPFAFPGAQELRVVEGPGGTTAALIPAAGQARLRLTLPQGVPSAVQLTLAFAVPKAVVSPAASKGEAVSRVRLLRHAFVNTQEDVIDAYAVVVLLPPGDQVQAVREALPKPGKTEAEPRVRLGRVDGRQSATLRAGPLRQGDDTSMSVELTSARRSWGWLVAGLALALLYLVHFRDLVAAPARGDGEAPRP